MKHCLIRIKTFVLYNSEGKLSYSCIQIHLYGWDNTLPITNISFNSVNGKTIFYYKTLPLKVTFYEWENKIVFYCYKRRHFLNAKRSLHCKNIKESILWMKKYHFIVRIYKHVFYEWETFIALYKYTRMYFVNEKRTLPCTNIQECVFYGYKRTYSVNEKRSLHCINIKNVFR